MLADKQLKNRIAKGDTEAFVELYDQHGESLLKYLAARVGPTDARDVLQNVFSRLVRYHKRLAKAANLTAYIYLTARNESNRFFTKSGVQPFSTTESMTVAESLPDRSTSAAEKIETKEAAQALLRQLDQTTRELVELKIFSGLTFKEVGKIVGMPEQTVASKYRRAIEKLKSQNKSPRPENSGGDNLPDPQMDKFSSSKLEKTSSPTQSSAADKILNSKQVP